MMLLAWTVSEVSAGAWLDGHLTAIALSGRGRDLDDPPPAGGFVLWIYELEGHASFRELLRHVGRLATFPGFRGCAWQGRHAFTATWGDTFGQERREVPGDSAKYLARYPADNQLWRVARMFEKRPQLAENWA